MATMFLPNFLKSLAMSHLSCFQHVAVLRNLTFSQLKPAIISQISQTMMLSPDFFKKAVLFISERELFPSKNINFLILFSQLSDG